MLCGRPYLPPEHRLVCARERGHTGQCAYARLPAVVIPVRRARRRRARRVVVHHREVTAS